MLIFDKIRNCVSMVRRRNLLNKNVKRRPTVRMGNSYGGFEVAAGKLDKEGAIVYSFGIGEDLSFSEDIIKRFDARVYAYDPTPKSIRYVEKSDLIKSGRLYFKPYGLSDKNEKEMFYLPVNDDWVSGSSVITRDKKETGIEVSMQDIFTCMDENGHDRIDVLKMDIEGSEFKVIDAWTPGRMPHADQICIEVHDRFFDDGYDKLSGLLKKLDELGYELISVSDTYEELTFCSR